MGTGRIIGRYAGGIKGIALIEVLIAMFVLVFGVMALSRMQSVNLGSTAANKARTEAIAIAQSRLEDMRNYMHEVDTKAQFNTFYAVAANANSAAVDGVNAAFTRTETIAADGDLRTIAVTVAWVDMAGDAQSETLTTDLTYARPGGPATLAMTLDGPLIDPPTGRARLGDGTLPDGAPTTSNDDGTAIYNPGDGDLKLVSGANIVLTLEEACNSDGSDCTDFVKIRGTVYIDRATQRRSLGGVYVQASDAAYCARYFLDDRGELQTVDSNTENAATTANGDYDYFHYTCYLGGGWHGNIGILLDGGIWQSDKVCQGDPVSANDWEAPVIALRRAYRGMIYSKDSNGDPVRANDKILFTSYGIADATELPVPNSGDHSHDFVLSSMATNQTEGSNCITQGVMVRDDANINGVDGDRFAGNPEDFFCLNKGNPDDQGDDQGYLDNYDSGRYGDRKFCPYDPTDPPVQRHVVSGGLSVQVDASDDNALMVAGMGVNTSDGEGNCLRTDFTYADSEYQANYECDVYDWGSGWSGTIHSTFAGYELDLSCTPNPLSLTAITADSGGNDIACSTATLAVIAGTVNTYKHNRILDSAVISGGSCEVGLDGLSYSCVTDSYDGSWDGTVTFVVTGGYLCSGSGVVATQGSIELDDSSGQAKVSGIVGVNQLDLNIQKNAAACTP